MSFAVTTAKQPEQILYGLWMASGDTTIAKDIPALSSRYYQTVGKRERTVLPFYVLTKNYSKETGTFSLFIGSTLAHIQLQEACLPEGLYATINVRPKLGFLWGLAIGEAKRYFYTQWLPASNCDALNLEYEYHTEKSLGRKPGIDLRFAIRSRPA